MPSVKHAVIAAAGLGSRLGLGKPKCLVEVGGRKILDWQLDLLRDVADVRVVVGYMEHEVIEQALRLRPDITIVRNPAYRTTTTQQSYWLGARYLTEPALYLDGDIIFEPHSFAAFLRRAAVEKPLIAITQAKTEQAVFTAVDGDAPDRLSVTAFSRSAKSEWEWANLAYLPPGTLQEAGGNVFERLATFLPLRAQPIVCCEMDTEADRAMTEAFVAKLQESAAAHSVLRVA